MFLRSRTDRTPCNFAIVTLIVLIIVLVGKEVAAGPTKVDPLTITTVFTVDAELLKTDSIWLGGFDVSLDPAIQSDIEKSSSTRERTSAILELRWIADHSFWIPRWNLQLVAAPNLLPPDFVNENGQMEDMIVLQEGSVPTRDHVYESILSYNPTSHALSFKVSNITTGDDLVRGQVQLNSVDPQFLGTPNATIVTETHRHVHSFTVRNEYNPLGIPLPLMHGFSWEWVRVVENHIATHMGYQFSDSETPGIRLHWPQSDVHGGVRFSIHRDGTEYANVTVLPNNAHSTSSNVIPLNISDLPLGDYNVDVSFVDADLSIPMSSERLRIVRSEIKVEYAYLGRDHETNVGVDVTLTPDSDLGAAMITLVAVYNRDAIVHHEKVLGEIDAGKEQRMPRTVHFKKNEAVVETFSFPVPVDPGHISFHLLTNASAELIDAEKQFVVSPSPPFSIWPVHDRLRAKQNEPAVLFPGDRYPDVGVYTSVAGMLDGVVIHDGTVIQSIPKRFVQAETHHLIDIIGQPPVWGRYEIRLKLDDGNVAVFDTLYFSKLPEDSATAVQSDIVFAERENGALHYVSDIKGDRVPDFSNSGYMGGGVAIPDIPVTITIDPGFGDDADRIQAAIDTVAALPMHANGFRGTVLLRRGTFEIGKTIKIDTSGIVLRGEGANKDGTVLLATGTTPYDLIDVRGSRAYATVANSSRHITDLYVPVGANSFHVEHIGGLTPGDTVIIRRHGNGAWIQQIGMDRILPRPDDPSNTVQWQPFHLDFERIIVAIDENRITVDAPIMNAIDFQWGGGELFKINDTRIEQVGVENLMAISRYDDRVTCVWQNEKYDCDENHVEYLVSFSNAKNSWLRDVTTVHFAHGPASLSNGSKHITVQDAQSLKPISTIDGSRRYPFHMNGELNLVQRVFSDGARHAFAFGARVPGPNVFLYSGSKNDYNWSEPHHRWSVGGLYDNISAPIYIQDRQWYGTGHGWAGAYYVTWNTTGALVVQRPPTAQNWAIGHVGTKPRGAFSPRDDGHWESFGVHVEPVSLYLKQLHDRLGVQAIKAIGY